MLTADRARELLTYDPETGVFAWRVSRPGAASGTVAGTRTGQGYIQLSIDGKRYRANRVAWLMTTGEWPEGVVDHRDGDRSNNRWANLRDTTQTVNAQNRRRSRGSLGLLGVTRSRGRFQAQIKAEGRHLHLGRFDTAEEAQEAYLAAKRLLHDGCTV